MSDVKRALQEMANYASPDWATVPSAHLVGQQGMKMQAALRMVLLFFAPGPWGQEHAAAWAKLQGEAGVEPDALAVTSKALCDTVRVVLGEEA